MLHLLAYMTADPPPELLTPEELLTDRMGKVLAICLVAAGVLWIVKKLGGSKKPPQSPGKTPQP